MKISVLNSEFCKCSLPLEVHVIFTFLFIVMTTNKIIDYNKGHISTLAFFISFVSFRSGVHNLFPLAGRIGVPNFATGRSGG
jgi:hypothetical protein